MYFNPFSEQISANSLYLCYFELLPVKNSWCTVAVGGNRPGFGKISGMKVEQEKMTFD